jgi:hypothetical protein
LLFVFLNPVSCVPNADGGSGLCILDCPVGIILNYLDFIR